jgi:hypothetical protein
MIAKELSNAVQKSAQGIEKKEVHICAFGEVAREGAGGDGKFIKGIIQMNEGVVSDGR